MMEQFLCIIHRFNTLGRKNVIRCNMQLHYLRLRPFCQGFTCTTIYVYRNTCPKCQTVSSTYMLLYRYRLYSVYTLRCARMCRVSLQCFFRNEFIAIFHILAVEYKALYHDRQGALNNIIRTTKGRWCYIVVVWNILLSE